MYYRATESWWQQFTGEVIIGSLLGKSLKMLPSRLESYVAFKTRHPGGKVLVPNNPGFRPYGSNPYFGYDSSAKPFRYNGAMPAGINQMARVVAVRTPSVTFAVTLSLLRKIGPMMHAGVTLKWQPGQNSAIDARKISQGRDVGTVSASIAGSAGTSTPIPYDVTFAFVFHAFHPKIIIRTE